MDLLCLSSLSLSDIKIEGRRARAELTVETDRGKQYSFSLQLTYEMPLSSRYQPILRLAFCMPLLNYGLFTRKIFLDFPLNEADNALLQQLNHISSRDISVNKILRRRAPYILPQFLPREDRIHPGDYSPKATIVPRAVLPTRPLDGQVNVDACGVLSSGGKESLLTYGLLKEISDNIHPLYVNESGGHWRTALPAYRYHQAYEPQTCRVWSNIDRFYTFMLDTLEFIRPDHRKIRADTYPLRLCIFPFYVIALLPIFIEKHIGNLLIGSEFDDPRVNPSYHGIPHYFGVYDQHQDYDDLMNHWYSQRIPGITQWSAVRTISGLLVEKILVNRYPHLAQMQRSCHSCSLTKGKVIPCGKCSKCLGVILFLLANNTNPAILQYPKKDITQWISLLKDAPLRLDDDEKNHALYLLGKNISIPLGESQGHIERIHLHKKTCDIKKIPPYFRKKTLSILQQYTNGYCHLKQGTWVAPSDHKIPKLG